MKELFDLTPWKRLSEKIGAKPYVPDDEWEPPYSGEDNDIPNIGKLIEGGRIVYIKDQSNAGYKFHVCYCRTIMDFLINKNYNIRYRSIFATEFLPLKLKYNKPQYPFPINQILNNGEVKQIRRNMSVCMNCLEALDYIDSNGVRFRSSNKTKKEKMAEYFSLEYFLREYNVNTPYAVDL